jgi:hypothetical protein
MGHRQDRQKEGARGRGARTANVSCCFRSEVEKRTVSTGATSTILRGEHTSAKKPDSCGTNTTTLQGENPSVPLEHSDGNRKKGGALASAGRHQRTRVRGREREGGAVICVGRSHYHAILQHNLVFGLKP